MNNIQINSSASAGSLTPNISSSASVQSTAATPATTSTSGNSRPAAGSAVPTDSGSNLANRSEQMVGASSASYSMTLEQVDHNQLSAFVLGLIASLFGEKDKKKEQDDAAMLLGLLMLSAAGPNQTRFSYSESYSSQVSQVSSATTSNAVQATPYTAASTNTSSAVGNSASVGSRINLSA